MTWKLYISTDKGANQFWHETNQLELSNAQRQVERLYGGDAVVINQQFETKER